MNICSLFPFVAAIVAFAVFAQPVFAENDKEFTLRTVEIDPLGADPETPWTVHSKTLNVRDKPSVENSRIIGSVKEGAEISGDYVIVEESDEEWLKIDFEGKTGFVSRLGFSRVHPRNRELIERHGNLPFGEEIVNRWWGIPLDYEADDLVAIPEKYRKRNENVNYRLRKEAMETLAEMFDAMREDGMEVFVSSPYRSGKSQTSIFRRRMGQNLAQRRSAPPGHSEHQLGTTCDISPEVTGRTLRNTDPQHAWLTKNAARFGWRQTYLAENIGETGYIEEPWHWRYVGREKLAAGEGTRMILEILNSEGHVEAAFAMGGAEAEAVKDFDASIEYRDISVVQYPLPARVDAREASNRVGLGTYVAISDFVPEGEGVSFLLTVREHVLERFETSHSPSRAIRRPMIKKYQFAEKVTLRGEETAAFGEMPNRKPWSVRWKN